MIPTKTPGLPARGYNLSDVEGATGGATASSRGQDPAVQLSRAAREPIVKPTHMSNEPNKVIYSMTGVSKAHEKKVILKD
ncbi:MAG: hypothetical protein M3478_12025, partial [Planctomycetota bacterium]|nr:hypothetical protein [Planctomycetota bacterium]